MLVYDRNDSSSNPAQVLLFSEFIELEFYFFRKYDPISGIIRNFDTFFSFFLSNQE